MPSQTLDAREPCTRGPTADRLHLLSDGRQLGYREYGLENGLAVIALHGTPGSRMKFAIAHEAASALGLRLICPDRWGYGLTQAPAKPTLAAYGSDIADLTSALGIRQFAVVGVSGGGPFAAAIAASLPHAVTATALVAPVGQMDTPHERAGVAVFHRFCFRVLPRIPGATRSVFTVFKTFLAISPAAAMKAAGARACASDRAVLADPATALRLSETFRMGLARGVEGPMIDMTLFSRPWGIDLLAATPPARGWIGTSDRNVPVAAARRLFAALPSAVTTVIPKAGHFWITRNYGDVLAWLADQMLAASQHHVADRSAENAEALKLDAG